MSEVVASLVHRANAFDPGPMHLTPGALYKLENL